MCSETELISAATSEGDAREYRIEHHRNTASSWQTPSWKVFANRFCSRFDLHRIAACSSVVRRFTFVYEECDSAERASSQLRLHCGRRLTFLHPDSLILSI